MRDSTMSNIFPVERLDRAAFSEASSTLTFPIFIFDFAYMFGLTFNHRIKIMQI